MVTEQELIELRNQVKNIKDEEKRNEEYEQLRQQLYQHERQNLHGIKGQFSNLKLYLQQKNWWLSFKLVTLGIIFFYSGIYTHFESYGSYFELGGIALFGLGLWRVPEIRNFFKDVLP